MAKQFTDRELKSGQKLLTVLDVFAGERATMPMQYMRAFLLVALDEGHTVGEYAVKSGVSPSVMSRHILDLGPRTRGLQPGLNLLFTKPKLENLREHTVHLTDKGRSLFHKLHRAQEG